MLTHEIMEKYGVPRRTLAYWRGCGVRPKRPAKTFGALVRGKHWDLVGRTVVWTDAGELAVKKMSKPS